MRLTLAQQVALTAGRDFWHTVGLPGVASIMLCDGPHGLRKQRGDGFEADSIPATCFPTASALAASWDVDLVEEVGVALGEEARAEGVSVLLGPGANIKRTALCGRNFEYFSEDPFLSSRMAAAWIRGVQSTGVGASMKHFAANNQEYRRYTVDALVDERAMREIYLASFEYAVTRARPATVMAAYNRLNGPACTTHAELLTGILRGEWGFDGVVVSDWGATNGRPAGIAAGLDLEMPGFAGAGDDEVLAAIHSGRLEPAAVERAAGAVVRLVERTAPAREPGHTYDRETHHQLARRAAVAGTVLLRNQGGLLPLPAAGTVAVIGAFARRPRYQGAGSSGVTPHRVDNLWDELAARTDPARLRYAEGYPPSGAVDETLLAGARAAARAADVAVVVVGLPGSYETEGLDRTHLDLPAAHNALVDAVAAVNPRVAVLLANGAPVRMPWADRVAAILEGYLGGQAGGSALAEVLLGRADPGGRLAETFPYALSDNPVHALPNGPATVEYRESVYVGYRYYDTAGVDVAFPFGHGLSYATFSWSPATVTSTGDQVTVSVRVTNTGARSGTEVVQVYVHAPESTVHRPAQELKGFATVRLDPGASADVTIDLDRWSFAHWDTGRHAWVVEGGAVEVRVGASSRDIRSAVRVDIAGDEGPFAAGAPVGEVFTAFPDLYGRPLPPNEIDRPGHYTLNTALGDLRHPAGRAFLAALRRLARRSFRRSADNPMVAIIDQVLAQSPARMLPMISQGRIGLRGARRLVRIANGFRGRPDRA